MYNAAEVSLLQKIIVNEQKCIFEHRRKVITIKNAIITFKFFNMFEGLFRAALYELNFVLHKGALFYCKLHKNKIKAY